MKFIEKITLLFKNIFKKQDKVKMLEAPQTQENTQKEVTNNQKQKNDFIESLKVNIENKPKKKKIETLICEGDGLGIKPKISA